MNFTSYMLYSKIFKVFEMIILNIRRCHNRHLICFTFIHMIFFIIFIFGTKYPYIRIFILPTNR